MKRFLAMLLCCMMLIAFAAGASAQESMYAAEIGRAQAMGLALQEMEGSLEETITFREYIAMLTRLIGAHDETLLGAWQEKTALAAQSDTEMRREDGILAVAYAMAEMGVVEYTGSDWDFFDQVQQHMNADSHALTWDYPLFPDWETTAFEWIGSNYMWGGIVVCAIEKSQVSGLAVYPYDFEGHSAHLADPLTRAEAIAAVLRLAESDGIDLEAPQYGFSVPEDMDFALAESRVQALKVLAEERKRQILDNQESVPCTGTAYYISNSGDDANDGLSPETAWATLERLKQQPMTPGDGVYFERGGLWRGAVGYYYDGVTVSAYGEGPKPKIYGSPENGADSEKWILHMQEDGASIWAYEGTNLECAGMVFDGGKAVGRRVHAWYDGDAPYDAKDRTQPFNLKAALCEDMLFYCDMDFGAQELPHYPDTDGLPVRIYLRCDAGNPGEIFDSIEFIAKAKTEDVAAIAFGPRGTLDNLCLMYHAGTVVSMTEHDDFTVQNCEIGWCGTRLECFVEPADDEPGIWTDGNAIQIIGSGCTVQNNYIHDVEGGGISLELGGEITHRVPFVGNIIRGNLIERCGDPLYVRDNDQDETVDKAFGAMEITDNCVFDTGYGWYEQQPSYINPAFYEKHSRNTFNFYGRIVDGESVLIRDNVFCRAYHGLLYMRPSADLPVFEGNTYAQDYGRLLMQTPGAAAMAMQEDEVRRTFEEWNVDPESVLLLEPR